MRKTTKINYGIFETSLGHMALAATDKGICYLQFGDDPTLLKNTLFRDFDYAQKEAARITAGSQWEKWLDTINSYLNGQSHTGNGGGLENLPLDICGTAFQNQIWDYLRSIPYGTTRSYSDIANAIGKPKAARASSRACATNKIGLAIPCHRIVCSDGRISGYRWGIDRKRALLALEKASVIPESGVNEGAMMIKIPSPK